MTGLEILLLKLLFGGGAVAITATLGWQEVSRWLEAHRASRNNTVELLRTALADGNYRVVANVFTPAHRTVATKSWTTKALDESLAARFGSADRIVIES
jgi:hypothetical protein